MAWTRLLVSTRREKKGIAYKAFSFLFVTEKMRRERKREKRRKIIIMCGISELWFCTFVEYKKNNNATNLSW